MSQGLSRESVETLALGVDNYVAYCIGERWEGAGPPPPELLAMTRSLVATAHSGGESEAMLIGILRRSWGRLGSPLIGAWHGDGEVYLAAIRLLHAQWTRTAG